jgi:hypothetical protein
MAGDEDEIVASVIAAGGMVHLAAETIPRGDRFPLAILDRDT